MRHVALILLILASLGSSASAQQTAARSSPLTVLPLPTPTIGGVISAEAIVARMMFFDRNRDGEVERTELNERLQPVIARGDVDGNGSLDAAEFRRLANAPLRNAVKQFGRGLYGFGDEGSVSSRLHIEGAIEDLRLAADVRGAAMRAANTVITRREAEAAEELLTDMRHLMNPEQQAAFAHVLKAAESPTVIVSRVDGVSSVTSTTHRLTMRNQFLLRSHVQSSAMSPASKLKALTAIEYYETRQKLDDAWRTELVASISGLLDAEQREDFAAALARRPVVANNIGFKIRQLSGGRLASAPFPTIE